LLSSTKGVLNSKKKKRPAPAKKTLQHQTEIEAAREVELQIQKNIERKKAELDALDDDNQGRFLLFALNEVSF
jgi:hypothetical protein